MSAKPSITPELIERIRAYYRVPGNAVGGSLHVLLDEGNVDADTARWCRDFAIRNDDSEGAAIAEILMGMSRTQRNKLAAMNFYPWDT